MNTFTIQIDGRIDYTYSTYQQEPPKVGQWVRYFDEFEGRSLWGEVTKS